MASRGLRKTYFFPHLKACERRNFDFCVFLRMCSVTKYLQIVSSVKQLHYTSVRTQKNQSFSSHRPSNGKKMMFFVIPEMPSKTFVMVLKKNFLITLRTTNVSEELIAPNKIPLNTFMI